VRENSFVDLDARHIPVGVYMKCHHRLTVNTVSVKLNAEEGRRRRSDME